MWTALACRSSNGPRERNISDLCPAAKQRMRSSDMTEANNSSDAIKAVQMWNDAWGKRDLDRMKEVAADDFIQWHATVRNNLSKDAEFDMLVEALKVMHIQFKIGSASWRERGGQEVEDRVVYGSLKKKDDKKII